MLTRRRSRPGFLTLVCLLLAAAVAFSPFAAAADADAGKGGNDGGDDERRRAGKEEAETEAAAGAAERGDVVAVAEAGGEVAAQGNATAKEGSLADMIDRALEKEFPESEGEQSGGGAWIWPGDPPRGCLGSGSEAGRVGRVCRCPCTSDLACGGCRVASGDCGHGDSSGWLGFGWIVLTSRLVLQRPTLAASTTPSLRSR